MALKIIWTEQAKRGLQKVLDFLEQNWIAKEILKLENNIVKTIDLLKSYPESCPTSLNNEKLRKAIVDKNNYIVYKYDKLKQHIVILNFRGTRQMPL